MKSRLHLRVSFYTRNGKGTRTESPVMLRVSLDGERSCFGQIGMEISPQYLSKNRVVSSHPCASELNKELEMLEAKVRLLVENLHVRGRLNLQSLKEELSGKRQSMQYVSVLFDELLSESENQHLSGKLATCSARRHKAFARVFMNFIATEYHRKDLRIDEVTKNLIADYEKYLSYTLGYSHNTLIKYLRFLNRVINRAIELDILAKNPFSGVGFHEEETHRGFLDENELASLMKTPIEPSHLDFVRDSFVFSCFTGLSYSDVYELRESNLSHFHDGSWILIHRQKSKVLSQIPLLPQALSIIHKYETLRLKDGRLFPLPCNQVTNRQLKEIQALCGIEKHLTFHLARHTFATLALTKGVSIETVGKILGHKKLGTTQIYAKVLTPKISHEMTAFSNRLQQEQFIV